MIVNQICGIIYYRAFKDEPICGKILTAFEVQKFKGRNGFGFVGVYKNRIETKRFTEEKEALKYLSNVKASEILFHHRIPTSTDNTVETNHPIIARSGFYKHNYYLVHNGMLWNDDRLKKEHEKLGIKYSTIDGNKFNDSEALLHELALIIEGKKESKDFGADGTLAFIIIQTDKNNNEVALYYGRNNNSPLTKTEVPKVLMSLRSIGGREKVQPNILFRYDYVSKETTEKYINFGQKISSKYINDVNDLMNDILSYKEIILPELNSLLMRELCILYKINETLLNEEKIKYENAILNNDYGVRYRSTYDYGKLLKNNMTLRKCIDYKK